jgi:hypothetical protein
MSDVAILSLERTIEQLREAVMKSYVINREVVEKIEKLEKSSNERKNLPQKDELENEELKETKKVNNELLERIQNIELDNLWFISELEYTRRELANAREQNFKQKLQMDEIQCQLNKALLMEDFE